MHINYTPRYISKYWLIIIHNILMNIEIKYMHSIQPPIIFNENYSAGQLININTSDHILAKKTKLLLEFINTKIKIDGHTQPLLLWSSAYFHEKYNFIFVPIKKNDIYDEMKWGYQSYFNTNIPDWAIVIGTQLKDKTNYVFNNLGIYRFPKSISFLDDNISGLKISSKLVSQKTSPPFIKNDKFNITPRQLRNSTAGNSSCWYSEDRKKDHGITNLDFDELHCINNGGIWDAPCKSDSDCPFQKENVCLPSGICDMPYGIERIGYTWYNKKSIPNCVGCNNLDFDTCCDGDKYKFKWTKNK